MTDEDDAVHGAVQDGEALLYDYFKHLTSLCILSLGGVLALADKGSKPELLIAVLVVIGLSAIMSFTGASEIVRVRFTGKPLSKSLNVNRFASPALLSVGLGMFLYIFAQTL